MVGCVCYLCVLPVQVFLFACTIVWGIDTLLQIIVAANK